MCRAAQFGMYAVHLQQLFQYLIGNAINYHEDKPPCIHNLARVRDNGIGIDPAYKERIFWDLQAFAHKGQIFRHRHWAGYLPTHC